MVERTERTFESDAENRKNLGSAVFVKNNFIMEESMLDHLGMFHTGQKRHKCHTCPEAFFYQKDLKTHFDEEHKELVQSQD